MVYAELAIPIALCFLSFVFCFLAVQKTLKSLQILFLGLGFLNTMLAVHIMYILASADGLTSIATAISNYSMALVSIFVVIIVYFVVMLLKEVFTKLWWGKDEEKEEE